MDQMSSQELKKSPIRNGKTTMLDSDLSPFLNQILCVWLPVFCP
jgi:hypothetical protein